MSLQTDFECIFVKANSKVIQSWQNLDNLTLLWRLQRHTESPAPSSPTQVSTADWQQSFVLGRGPRFPGVHISAVVNSSRKNVSSVNIKKKKMWLASLLFYSISLFWMKNFAVCDASHIKQTARKKQKIWLWQQLVAFSNESRGREGGGKEK